MKNVIDYNFINPSVNVLWSLIIFIFDQVPLEMF